MRTSALTAIIGAVSVLGVATASFAGPPAGAVLGSVQTQQPSSQGRRTNPISAYQADAIVHGRAGGGQLAARRNTRCYDQKRANHYSPCGAAIACDMDREIVDAVC